jgi:hypothetical protein
MKHIAQKQVQLCLEKRARENWEIQGGKDKLFPSLLEFVFCQQKALCGLTNVGRGQA